MNARQIASQKASLPVDKQSIITYTVWALDVWGHSPGECRDYDCPCIVTCDTCRGEGTNDEPHPTVRHVTRPMPCQGCEGTGKEHDANRCECSYAVNDRSKVGTVEVTTDEGATHNTDLRGQLATNGTPLMFTSWHASDAAITRALIEGGYLKDHVTAEELTIDGEEDCSLSVDDATDGRPIFQLEFESSRDVDAPTD